MHTQQTHAETYIAHLPSHRSGGARKTLKTSQVLNLFWGLMCLYQAHSKQDCNPLPGERAVDMREYQYD